MREAETAGREFGGAALPWGDAVFSRVAYGSEVLARVDRLCADGLCASGRLEVSSAGRRLVCLIRNGAPLLGGELEGEGRRRILPLRRFHDQAEQLSEATATLLRHDERLVALLASLFCATPDLLASTRHVDPYRVLDGLGQEAVDASVAFEREGAMALLGLTAGKATGVYFARERDDPGGDDPAERFLLHVLEAGAPPGRLEIYRSAEEARDPDAGKSFGELSEEGSPPPPVEVLVRIGRERELARRPFTARGVVIGRDSRCEVFLDNLAVSRRHARIGWERDRFFVEDLGSANGTRLHGEGVRIADLEVGDEVEIGKFTLSLEMQRPRPGVQETMFLSARSIKAGLQLEGDGQRVRLLGSVIIGKGQGVDVAARGMGVRPVHARVEDRGDGLRLTCFGGVKVKVNGTSVSQCALSSGDRLSVGRSTFTITTLDAAGLAETLGIVDPSHPKGG
jgi:hypothetical protein